MHDRLQSTRLDWSLYTAGLKGSCGTKCYCRSLQCCTQSCSLLALCECVPCFLLAWHGCTACCVPTEHLCLSGPCSNSFLPCLQEDISPEDKQMLQWVVTAVQHDKFRFHNETGMEACIVSCIMFLLSTPAFQLVTVLQMIPILRQISQLGHSPSS